MPVYGQDDDTIGQALSRMGYTPASPSARAPGAVSPYTITDYASQYGITPESLGAAAQGFRPEGGAIFGTSGFRPEGGSSAATGFRPEGSSSATIGFRPEGGAAF